MERNIPLFAQVKEDIIDLIKSGSLSPGDRLPTQQELCEKYKISHMTMRRVINELTSEGVLNAVTGKGIYVSETKLVTESSPMISFTQDMKRRGMSASSKVLEAGIIGASIMMSKTLDVEPGASLIYLRRLRLADNIPMAIQSTFLNSRFCHGLIEYNLESNSLFDILINKFDLHLSNKYLMIGTEMASKEIADLLQITVPASLLVTEQITYLDTGQAIEFVRSVYRGDRFQISIP
ncbi:MAG: GntR family transcriptional regulator [Anaerolineaceae bacterium]